MNLSPILSLSASRMRTHAQAHACMQNACNIRCMRVQIHVTHMYRTCMQNLDQRCCEWMHVMHVACVHTCNMHACETRFKIP
jgi:hypothetical protein